MTPKRKRGTHLKRDRTDVVVPPLTYGRYEDRNKEGCENGVHEVLSLSNLVCIKCGSVLTTLKEAP